MQRLNLPFWGNYLRIYTSKNRARSKRENHGRQETVINSETPWCPQCRKSIWSQLWPEVIGLQRSPQEEVVSMQWQKANGEADVLWRYSRGTLRFGKRLLKKARLLPGLGRNYRKSAGLNPAIVTVEDKEILFIWLKRYSTWYGRDIFLVFMGERDKHNTCTRPG